MAAFNFGHHVVPLLSAETTGTSLTLKKFLGAGFYIDDRGTLLTCRHVVDLVDVGDVLAIKDIKTNQFGVAQHIHRHPRIDIAVIRTQLTGTSYLELDTDRPGLGRDVGCFGFAFNSQSGASITTDPRLEKGHVLGHRPFAPQDSAWVYELNFAVTSGFSGGPIFDTNYSRYVGMVFGNIESRYQSYAYEEVEEAGAKHKHTIERVLEYGLAFPSELISEFVQQLDMKH